MKRWLRYLVLPAIAFVVVGTVLLFLRLGIEGIVAGGLLIAAGVDMFFIGASRPLRHA